jgi:hypothetical protein
MRLAAVTQRHFEMIDFTHWNFHPTGDHVADARTGRSLARQYLALQDDTFWSQSLGRIARTISSLDRDWSALETSFFSSLASTLRTADVPSRAPQLLVIDGGRE